eukprot:TRINITY_DN2409_c0_g1_i1.p1 TRINITY_DN2409_c0_g1~~TRINITY_DN2409_c0_g1_i1.p1  ORF type:complete len:802 (+),score=170.04 TRINITY_DN2409_c0_g1_i1:256-2661(+)
MITEKKQRNTPNKLKKTLKKAPNCAEGPVSSPSCWSVPTTDTPHRMMQSSSNPAAPPTTTTSAPPTSQRDKLRPFVQGLFLEVVQELYDNREEAEKYAQQTEELIHQQTSDDSDYMKNFQQRFEELKELKKKFSTMSASPSTASTSFTAAAAQSNSMGVNLPQAASSAGAPGGMGGLGSLGMSGIVGTAASSVGGAMGTTGAGSLQAQAAQRLFMAQQIQQSQTSSAPQVNSAASIVSTGFPSILPNLPTNPPSPGPSVGLASSLVGSVRSAADLAGTLAQTNSVLNTALGGPATLSGMNEGTRKRPNPSSSSVTLTGNSPSSSVSQSGNPGSQGAAKRPRTSNSGPQQPTVPRGSGGNATQLLHFLTQAEGKIKANYVSAAGRQQPHERLMYESLLQEVNQIKSEIEVNAGCLQDEKFQRRVTALVHRLRAQQQPKVPQPNQSAASSGPMSQPSSGLPKMEATIASSQIPIAVGLGTGPLQPPLQPQRPVNPPPVVPAAPIQVPPGVQGYHQFWTPKSSMVESSKQIKDLLDFQDSKQGFTVRHQPDDSLAKKMKVGDPMSKVQLHVNPSSAVSSISSYPMQVPIQPSPNQASPHPLSPYGIMASPGGISMAQTTGMHNASMGISRPGQVNPVVGASMGQLPMQSASSSLNNPSQTSPSNIAGGLNYANAMGAAAVAVNVNGGSERLTLNQELAKIREFQLFTLNQVAGQNTRWTLYLFDIQQQERVPSLLVGIRRDYELEEVPVPDMIDYRVQKGKSEISDENIQLLQKVLKQKMQNQRPRLYDLIFQWVDILKQLFAS